MEMILCGILLLEGCLLEGFHLWEFAFDKEALNRQLALKGAEDREQLIALRCFLIWI